VREGVTAERGVREGCENLEREIVRVIKRGIVSYEGD